MDVVLFMATGKRHLDKQSCTVLHHCLDGLMCSAVVWATYLTIDFDQLLTCGGHHGIALVVAMAAKSPS